MNKIERIVNELEIKQSKELLEESKKKIFANEREMAKLTFNIDVGRYAFDLDEFDYYSSMISKTKKIEKANELFKKLTDINSRIINCKKTSDIEKYDNLKSEIISLRRDCKIYYRLINNELREYLKSYDIPDIYVYQGKIDDKYDYCKNILSPDIVSTCNNNDNIVYPEYDIKSNRDLRHFYNKVSFKYLEELTKDYSYKLEGKNIGKVRILK